MGGDGSWKKGGTGTASADGKTIITDAGSGIPRFCGVCGLPCFRDLQNKSPNPPCNDCDASAPPKTAGNPVTLATGQELAQATDLSISALPAISIGRTYNPYDAFDNIAGFSLSLGVGWALDYDAVFLPFDGPQKRIVLPGNARINFTVDGDGAYRNHEDGRFRGAALTLVAAERSELRFKDGRIWRFQAFPDAFPARVRGALPQVLTEQLDPQGNRLLIQRSGGKVTQVQSGSRVVSFHYGANGYLAELRDPLGRTVRYTYNTDNRLATVTAPDGGVTRYNYDNGGGGPYPVPIETIEVDNLGSVYGVPITPKEMCGQAVKDRPISSIQYPGQSGGVSNHNGSGSRILKQILADGSELKFSYSVVGACSAQLSCGPFTPIGCGIDPVTGRKFCSAGQTRTLCTVNTSIAPIVTDSLDSFQAGRYIIGGNVVATTVTDSRGHTTTQRFNPAGMGTEYTDQLGQTTRYQRDHHHRITQITDPLGRVQRYSYDEQGNKTRVIDSENRVTDYAYDPKQQHPQL